MKQYKLSTFLTGLTIIIIGLLLFSYQSPINKNIEAGEKEQVYSQAQYANNSIMMKEDIVQWNKTVEQLPLTEEIIIEKTESFIDILLQDIDEDYKVKGVSSKEALINQFNDVITKEAVEPYIDFYFEEFEDGLYIVPTELPPWFIAGEPYEMDELENGNVIVKQENELDLYGVYQIEIEFSYQEDWRIVRVEYPPVNEEQLDII
ncbi:hypothetical protein ACS127_16760 [Amphibacillus sp. Q70]|uniref:hypothetical protein n=1 Tax=Amphibacillus sp. Q70 TaxID=3453416 RepID=UPI003F8751EC